MFKQYLSTIILATSAVASPLGDFPSWEGFSNPSKSYSVGGKAVCITGDVPVTVTATNQKLLYSNPANQSAVTETFVEYLEPNSTLGASVDGGMNIISGTYSINAKICYPIGWKATRSAKSIQFLIHGIAFDKSYWDVAPGYGYIDSAALEGYPTFSYDRLGTGASDHPDPIQVVQSFIQVEIAHSLASSLRSGKFSGVNFDHIIGIGHSYGSIQLLSVAGKYPTTFDALALTGFSYFYGGIPYVFADFDSAIARENQPSRFKDLPNGYLVSSNSISNQFGFFRFPNYDPDCKFPCCAKLGEATADRLQCSKRRRPRNRPTLSAMSLLSPPS
jgi:Alpha/beta hydrolase family